MYDPFEPDPPDVLATHHDAMYEYATNVGRDLAERGDRSRAWILTDYDVYVANPFYRGPPVPHPEYGDWDDEVEDEIEVEIVAVPDDDDFDGLPF